MKYTVVLPAAGSGKRMRADRNKLLLELSGKPIFIYTLEVFDRDPDCEGMWLAVKEDERELIEKYVEHYGIKKVKGYAAGGAERQDSVRAGLEMARQSEVVLVHDAARPFISPAVIRELVERANESGAAIAGVPVKDTIKKVREGVITETVDRAELWMIQTPQAFRYKLLMEAAQRAQADGFLGTDEAMLVERTGHPVQIVESTYENVKMTTPDDLIYGKAILESRLQEE
ncbi:MULTISPECIES: 2-C-methyl-D-erythritol 4-phosphate cytidylyltransferase [unclassified Planococcus (in: firmicutes)]|uniref:2-C-methyl-D-erythritol 4-phosphate cytidylyltransferase n=1 Tax=Planococcus TaxID=1372 RepID=UPI000C34F906|nr:MULTISPECIES: 2-C-methyl-D-erythritol 4-phosphate cytidylyltransferase [unclassified Planococcus (in: firmicutes)]AUD12585.1 2-C-methyl-D-erythritol 4-phosphate cytidylyltransferase [Planococcus sp. MB-3u-03]PKG44579.1 2-C-methyl-D-erythritol 4-phosphate cytidylyltransferase [Planococcus sp. Urea-trap-24]PKG91338.1 2-C-methyl-D-erythritol 4-phosphate cytidylyltransferase [Planococcus sp. Urea-3u-39]PKH35960.1 2-C-methyl-D-erythritol 4-phosphate cytidylyltransferase [Planococcus sp. MB-3u-09]